MRRAILSLALWSLIHTFSQAQTVTSLNHGLVVEPTGGTSQFDVSWWGAVDTGYFLQQSDDLLTWTYVPLVLGGVGDVETWGFQSTAPRLFLRLVPFDDWTGDPTTADEDSDGLNNTDEVVTHHTDPFNYDSDSDSLDDYIEVMLTITNPNSGDTDGDTLGDYWELLNNLDPNQASGTNGASADPDLDGLTNAQEQEAGSNPHLADSDSDGLSDAQEFQTYHTSPVNSDSDSDGATDYAEAVTYLTNPLNPDSDNDTLTDGWEISSGLNPLVSSGDNGPAGDPDGDLLINSVEYSSGTLALDADTDDDQLTDYQEVMLYFTSPTRPDTDGDGLTDAEEVVTHLTNPFQFDTDADGLSDGLEVHSYMSNPKNADTDGDLMPDGWEVDNLFNLLSSIDAQLDADADGITNLGEYYLRFEGKDPHTSDSSGYDWNADQDFDGISNENEINIHHTDPTQPDTDNDRLDDGWELQYGFDPLVHNDSDAISGNSAADDPDGDGLTNLTEAEARTNPNQADTDGDGISDAIEITQASDPNNASDKDPAPNGVTTVHFHFGDWSGSHSEKYKVFISAASGDGQNRTLSNDHYGETKLVNVALRRGVEYSVRLEHVGTSPEYKGTPRPDFDYVLEIEHLPASGEDSVPVILEDPNGILGGHQESDTFFAQGKTITMVIPSIEWVTPKGSPVTAPVASGSGQNELAFNAAQPGVLYMQLKMKVLPTGLAAKIQSECGFAVPGIPGSTKSWIDATTGVPTAVGDLLIAAVEYSTLPADNAHFGLKTATFSYGNSYTTTTEFEVFFDREATNHPGGQVGSPNWYHYWSQVLGGGHNITYDGIDPQGRLGTTKALRDWSYLLPRDKTEITIFDATKAAGKDYLVGDMFSGIDRFIATVYHEAAHVDQIARADALLPTNGSDSFRHGWSWNQPVHNHWAKGIDGQWGVANTDDDGNTTTDDAFPLPPFELGHGDDVNLGGGLPSTFDWPAVWALPSPNLGPTPVESEAINFANDSHDEHQSARSDWGFPGKNHLTIDKYDD